MTARSTGRRVAMPAYYLGRPASFWIARLSPRRRNPPPSVRPTRTDPDETRNGSTPEAA